MSIKAQDLVLDIGNTRTKFAYFQGGDVVDNGSVDGSPDIWLKQLLEKPNIARIAVASVSRKENEIRELLDHPGLFVVTGDTDTPLSTRYTTMGSLGSDRIANAVAAHICCPDQAVLAIDAGTCITYDLVDSTGAYKGGTIAPGLHLRAKAMNAYSARLPLVVPRTDTPLVGTDTQGSLLSGVMHGTKEEVNGLIARYEELHDDLSVFITGGDAMYFTSGTKSGIFADPLLTLKGIHAILEHQT